MKTSAFQKTFHGFALLLAVLIALMGVMMPAMAEEEEPPYYKTWADYTAAGEPATTWNNVADAMDNVFATAVSYFEAGDYDEAYAWVNVGYYGYYETTGFERIAMGYISGSRKTEVELQFSACKAVCRNKGSLDDFNEEIETLKSMIHTDANVLDGVSDDSSNSSDTTTTTSNSNAAAVAAFAACFSIILREGFEAILIVGAIIAYLRKAAGDDKKKAKETIHPVYWGSLLGIILSFVLAWLLNEIKLANTAKQELIEGCTALLAVCVLYYVSNWMLSKSESDAWQGYIKSKVAQGSDKGSHFALAFTAFLAVFREGAEVVLFYQPMLAGDNIGSVWSGFVIGCVCLVFVYLAIHFLSVKIPLRPFFTATSILMFLMSISFLGAGIKELIEGDVIAYVSPDWLQWIPTNDVLDVLGIYPTLQTLVPQLILLIVSIVLFVIQTKKNNKIHAEAEARRAEERAKAEAERKAAEEAQLRATIREVVLEVLAEGRK